MSTFPALGTQPLGWYPAPPVPPVLAALLSQPSITDTVLLLDVQASDGVLTSTSRTPAMGTAALGTLPGGVTGGAVPLRWSDRDWTSGPAEGSIHYEGRVGGISIARGLPLRPADPRRVAPTVAEIVVDNTDGRFDAPAASLSIEGQPASLSLLSSRAATLGDRRMLLAGVSAGWRADARALRLRMRDVTALLDVPMLGVFAGTGGAEGGPELAGKVRPEVWGTCRGVSPVLLDAARRIYAVHPRQVLAVMAVFDRGALVTQGTDRGGYAALEATAPAAGTWDWANTPSGTWFRLGSEPDGAVTCDVAGDASGTGYSETLAGMMRALLLRHGGVPINAASFASVAAILPGRAGVVFDAPQSWADALATLAAGGCLWWGDAGDGAISVGRLAAPQARGGLDLDPTALVEEPEPMEPPVPVWRVTASWRRNWTVLSATDLAIPSAVGEARHADLQQPGRTVQRAAVARRQRDPLAEDLTIDTLFDDEADAAALADNLLDLMAPGRGLWRLPLGLAGYGVALGQQVRATWPRHALAGGRELRVIGMTARGGRADLLGFG